MNTYDFDAIHERRGTGDIKYQCAEDVIPLWVADMDFRAPQEVTDALIKTAQRGIFGYTQTDEEYDALVKNWYGKRFGWDVADYSVVKTPGVVFALGAIINAMTEKGDSVLICQPVYYPFEKIVLDNGRKLVVSELAENEGRYTIDFADLEEKIVREQVKLFLLCSPHNPVGRVWTAEELRQIGQLCLKHHVYIAADEIHSDFVYEGYRHTPIASLSDEIAAITITCTAPSKTFNLAGLQGSNLLIKDRATAKRIIRAIGATGYFSLNTMVIASTKAVYRCGEGWLDALLAYLEESKGILRDAFPTESQITLIEPEGTYLAWLDCRKTGLSSAQLYDKLLHEAKVWLHKGDTFGAGGEGFLRLNFACPHSVLKEAIERIKNVISY